MYEEKKEMMFLIPVLLIQEQSLEDPISLEIREIYLNKKPLLFCMDRLIHLGKTAAICILYIW